MIAQMSFAARALTVVGVVLWSSAVLGQAPGFAGNVWYPTGLSFDRCMQRGEATLREMGSKDVHKDINFTGMGWLNGSIGDYRLSIACITAKDVVVFNGAGPDFAAAKNYIEYVRNGMNGSR